MTLAFSWATNTNYSTGPDNGTATKVDPASTANGFVNGTIAAAQHLNFLFDAVGDQIVQAVDGIGGGTYNLGANLTFQSTGEVRFANVARITSGGSFVADGSCTFNQTTSFNANILVATIADSDALLIDDDANSFRLTLTPQSIQPDTGGADPSWLPGLSGVAFAGTTTGWYQTDVNAAFCIVFPLNLPVGDDIVTVTAQVDGSFAGVGHSVIPASGELPVLALVRVSGTGVATVVARREDQSANVAAYNAQHTITLASGALDDGTLPHTVLATDAYYVVLHGATGANAEADKFGVNSVSGTCVARSYRSALMTY